MFKSSDGNQTVVVKRSDSNDSATDQESTVTHVTHVTPAFHDDLPQLPVINASNEVSIFNCRLGSRPTVFATLTNSLLFWHLLGIKKDLEREFRVRLRFVSSDGNDEFSAATSQVTCSAASSCEFFLRIMIYGERRRANFCMRYMEALNDNMYAAIVYISDEFSPRDVEALLKRRVREIREEANEASNSSRTDPDDKSILTGVRTVETRREISVFVASANADVAIRYRELTLQDLELSVRVEQSNAAALTVFEPMVPELRRQFNVRINIDHKNAQVKLYYLKSSENDIQRILEIIVNIGGGGGSPKMAIVSPRKEKLLVIKYFNLERLSGVEASIRKINVSIKQDEKGRGFFILKSTSQQSLDNAIRMCKEEFARIERELVYNYLEFPFNTHESILKDQDVKRILQNSIVHLKTTKTTLAPSICLRNKKNNIKLYICRGDIVDANTSATVSIVDSDLNNQTGIAKRIAEAAGEDYKLDCKNFETPLNGSQVYVAAPGNISGASILNVVKPVYSHASHLDELSSKYKMGLEKACEMNYKSIAFPLIGGRKSEWPILTSLQILLDSVSKIPRGTSLEEVFLVEIDRITFESLIGFIQNNSCCLANYSVEFDLLKRDQDGDGQDQPRVRAGLKKWYWLDELNRWIEYDYDMLQIINMLESSKQFVIHFSGLSYKFDLVQKVQINLKTGFQRRICCDLPTETSYAQWYWVDWDNKESRQYDPRTNSKIERAYQSGQPHIDIKMLHQGSNQYITYRLHFSEKYQENLTTGFKRDIHRAMQLNPVKKSDKPKDSPSDLMNKLNNVGYKFKLWLVGKQANVDQAKAQIRQLVDGLETLDMIENQSLLAIEAEMKRKGFFRKAPLEWSKNGVTIEQIGNHIKISGPVKKELDDVKEQIYRLLLGRNQIAYPIYWNLKELAKLDDQTFQIITVNPGSEEWRWIEDDFKRSLPTNRIISIQRIQNPYIYKYYFEEKNYLMRKNKKPNANEVYLWHGTSSADPYAIFSGDRCGFDLRYANDGLWGRGIYFAATAWYSDHLAFIRKNQHKQLLYSSVLLGDCSPEIPSNRSLRMPPLKNSANSSDRYDSVKGVTCNTDVYIVYDSQKAYPAYQVIYE